MMSRSMELSISMMLRIDVLHSTEIRFPPNCIGPIVLAPPIGRPPSSHPLNVQTYRASAVAPQDALSSLMNTRCDLYTNISS
jgi:hypothetical protein